MRISLIAAMGKNKEIGYQNKLLWNIKEDMNWFKENTLDKPVIMGRNTYESIGKPLPDRVNVVLSQKGVHASPDVIRYQDIEDILYDFQHWKEIMIIGGAQVYKQFLPLASRIYLTRIESSFTADTFFPEINLEEWETQYYRKQQEVSDHTYTFEILDKKQF